jgi:hypothetical protein
MMRIKGFAGAKRDINFSLLFFGGGGEAGL